MKRSFFAFLVVTLTLLSLAFEMTADPGDSRYIGKVKLSDTLSGQLLTNTIRLRQDLYVKESLRVDGQAVFNNNLNLGEAINLSWGEFPTLVSLSGQYGHLYSNANQYTFSSSGNYSQLMEIDSAQGVKVYSYLQSGSTGPVEAVKMIPFKAPQPNNTVAVSHGLTLSKIIGFTAIIRDDTTSTVYGANTHYSPNVFYIKIDASNVSVTIPGSPTGNGVANDSGYCRITYRR